MRGSTTTIGFQRSNEPDVWEISLILKFPSGEVAESKQIMRLHKHLVNALFDLMKDQKSGFELKPYTDFAPTEIIVG